MQVYTQEDCYWLRLVRFSFVGRGPTSATERSVQLNLESGTICRRSSGSQICHTDVSNSRWRRFFILSLGPKRSVNPLRIRNPLSNLLACYVLTYLLFVTFDLTIQSLSIMRQQPSYIELHYCISLCCNSLVLALEWDQMFLSMFLFVPKVLVVVAERMVLEREHIKSNQIKLTIL